MNFLTLLSKDNFSEKNIVKLPIICSTSFKYHLNLIAHQAHSLFPFQLPIVCKFSLFATGKFTNRPSNDQYSKKY